MWKNDSIDLSAIEKTWVQMCLAVLFVLGLFYRAYPHLYLIPRWIIEEDAYSYAIFELIKTGTTLRLGYQPILEQYVLYYFYLLTYIDPTIIIQYANPFFGALTVFSLYFLFKHFLTSNQAIIATTLWAFSETVIYRSAVFNSTEAFGFFLAITALVYYIRNKYLKFSVLIILSLFSHILPAVFILGIVFLDTFLKGNTKQKSIVIVVGICLVLFLYSPLNPHQRMIYSITPNIILSQFSLANIFLYNIQDILLGVGIFSGSVVLLLLTFVSIVSIRPKKQLMYIYLFGAISLFIASWMFYSPYLLAPTRVVFYFIVPLSFFSTILITKSKHINQKSFTFIIVLIMIISSLNGVDTMLYTSKAVTLDEYYFIENSVVVNDIESKNYDNWWADTPLRSALTIWGVFSKSTFELSQTYVIEATKITINVNSTKTTTKIVYENGVMVTKIVPPIFKYVVLSPRMEKSAYFNINTKYRTIQISQPVVDIWKDMPDWKLVEEYKNIKLYKWIGIDIEG